MIDQIMIQQNNNRIKERKQRQQSLIQAMKILEKNQLQLVEFIKIRSDRKDDELISKFIECKVLINKSFIKEIRTTTTETSQYKRNYSERDRQHYVEYVKDLEVRNILEVVLFDGTVYRGIFSK